MTISNTRRDILQASLALAGLGVPGIPQWALPARAQSEALVAFTDLPENASKTPPGCRE